MGNSIEHHRFHVKQEVDGEEPILNSLLLWPMMPPENDEQKCQDIYWNLLLAIERGKGHHLEIVLDIKNTRKCDHFHDLSQFRQAVTKQVSPTVLSKVLHSEPSPMDMSIVEAVDFATIKTDVYGALDWKRKARYNAWKYFDQAVMGAGIGATLAVTYAFLLRRKVAPFIKR